MNYLQDYAQSRPHWSRTCAAFLCPNQIGEQAFVRIVIVIRTDTVTNHGHVKHECRLHRFGDIGIAPGMAQGGLAHWIIAIRNFHSNSQLTQQFNELPIWT